MSEAESDPVRGFFGVALIAVGALMMFLCGGCGALFFIGFLISGLRSSNHEDVSMVILPIILGGAPALVGFGLFALGRVLRRPWSAPKPPPSAPPPG
jgi:hypothetical protein